MGPSFDDRADIQALTAMFVAFIINIRPIITKNTMLIEMKDIVSAPDVPTKLKLEERVAGIYITPINILLISNI